MRAALLCGLGLLLCCSPAGAQNPFHSMRDALPDLLYSTAAWGDYDADGWLDLVLMGVGPGGAVDARIYHNERDTTYLEDSVLVHETRYASILTLAPPVGQGDAAWGDYDNDGDLDLLVAGRDVSGVPVTRLYEHVGGGQFMPADILEGIYAGAVDWGDYDGDGDLDVLLCGISETGAHLTLLYENQGDGFVRQDAGLPGVAYGDAAWGDYDGDGDLDVLLSGLTQPQATLTRIYRNEGGGVFVDTGAELEGLFYSTVAWGDYDSDGGLDVLLSGGRLSPFVFEGVVEVYRNDGGTFTKQDVDLRGSYDGVAAWGDYDHDGDLDILISGGTHPFLALRTDPLGSRIGTLYVNDGGRFRPAEVPGLRMITFGGGLGGDAIWGDYDGDGDLDFMVVGQRGTGSAFADVYRNDLHAFGFPRNTPPLPPQGLEAAVEDHGVRLSWAAASDAETPAPGLSYNVRVGTVPGGVDVVPPMSVPATGYRLVPARGNAGQGTTGWVLRNLAPGRYYWSVQAVDHSFKGSPFAEEQTFVVEGDE